MTAILSEEINDVKKTFEELENNWIIMNNEI
jgi:hypothetical protein